jgi:long-subunit fatty acid transport protein
MIRINLLAAVMLALFSSAAISRADEFHYNNILVGDRASGMGGAYTAVSDDSGGMYFNPAGIAYSTGKNLSASVNAFSVSNRTYKGVIGGQDWTRSSSTLLPNFFGIIQPVGKLKLGFSYAVPDSNQEDQDQSFKRANFPITSTKDWGSTIHVINFNNINNTNLFGPSAAIQVSDSFSVGATLYVHKRNTETILNQTIQSDNKVIQVGANPDPLKDERGFIWQNGYLETDEWGLKPVLGVMWTPVDKLSIGVAVTKTFVLKSEVLSQSTFTTNDPDVAATNIPIIHELIRSNDSLNISSEKRKYPTQISAGAAFFPSSSLLLSGDLSYYSAFEYTLANTPNKRNAVVNGALGAEYYLNKNWAIRGGLFTDFANTPKVVEGGTNQKEHIDLYGGSLTLSHFTKNTSISCGGSYKFGSGKSQIDNGAEIQDANADSWAIFVSSSYTY